MNAAPATAAAPLRREDDALLRGQGCYGQDVPLPGALHVAFARSAHAHARILALHLEDARAMPGVVAVLAGSDLGHQTMPPVNPLLPLLEAQDFPLLAQSTLSHVGQPMALVLARTTQQAAAAAARVRARWDWVSCSRNRPSASPVPGRKGKIACVDGLAVSRQSCRHAAR